MCGFIYESVSGGGYLDVWILGCSGCPLGNRTYIRVLPLDILEIQWEDRSVTCLLSLVRLEGASIERSMAEIKLWSRYMQLPESECF